MAYIAIADFKYGMDRRRPRIAGVSGTLYTLKNAHISRGGDIERAKKFVLKYTLPLGTHGLARVRNQLYVFGSADLVASMPLGVLYQRLISPTNSAMTRVLEVARLAASSMSWRSMTVLLNIFIMVSGSPIGTGSETPTPVRRHWRSSWPRRSTVRR